MAQKPCCVPEILACLESFYGPQQPCWPTDPYLPRVVALWVVRLSGALEILGGLGLLVTWACRAAAWGLVALLIAVFLANIYMALHPVETARSPLRRCSGGSVFLYG